MPPLAPPYRVSCYRSWLLSVLLLAGCGRVESIDARWLINTTHQPHQAGSSQWSGHRGGTLQGVSDSSRLPVAFDQHRQVRWSLKLPGCGNSSPTVYGDRVFLTAQRQEEPEDLVVLCVDRTDGRVVWMQSVGPPAGPTHRRNGHASATVATDGERIYATFGSRGLFCFTVDGEWLWQLPLDHLEHPWGHASSPVLSGDLVVQLADGAHGSCLLAVNCYTGELLWKTERASSGCWTTPVLVPLSEDGQRRWEIVVNGTGSTNGTAGYVIAYAPDSGQELWRVAGTNDIPCPTAIVGESLLISTSGRNGPIMAIRPGGRGDVTGTHVAWRLPRGGPQVPTGVIQGAHLYLLADHGVLRCLDVATGERTWERRLHGRFSASLVSGDGKLYAVSEGGDVYVVAADESGTLLAVNRLRQPCTATPAIAQGDLLLRTQQHLFCFAEQPALAEQQPSTGAPVVAHDAMEDVEYPASVSNAE